jgi:hypothetical protein
MYYCIDLLSVVIIMFIGCTCVSDCLIFDFAITKTINETSDGPQNKKKKENYIYDGPGPHALLLI